MHARYYSASVGRFLSVDPVIDIKHVPTTPQAWNRFVYAGDNPVSRLDPDGRRDVYVAIWTPRFPYVFAGGSVGHVAVLETDGRTLLSEFPDPHGMRGKNVVLSYQDTMAKEDGRNADALYKIHVPDDAKFDAAVEQKRNAQTWVALPISNESTNCVDATSVALKAGGVPVTQPTVGTWNVTPGALVNTLNTLIEIQKTATEKLEWSVERIYPGQDKESNPPV
jgi:hypothetical protein